MTTKQERTYLALALVGSIFFGEIAVMLLLMHIPPLNPIVEALIDATTLVILVFPTLYFFVFRPMAMHIKRSSAPNWNCASPPPPSNPRKA
ncbi:hypothetical protein [Methylogaea oryzae]|uniref:hypothetical protein n=1 Tax=Methylogaea oryzae TaxID=1295382 RepID=UPI0012E24B14|nr:hypothetical protein [Methylogaea oryzae]